MRPICLLSIDKLCLAESLASGWVDLELHDRSFTWKFNLSDAAFQQAIAK